MSRASHLRIGAPSQWHCHPAQAADVVRGGPDISGELVPVFDGFQSKHTYTGIHTVPRVGNSGDAAFIPYGP